LRHAEFNLLLAGFIAVLKAANCFWLRQDSVLRFTALDFARRLAQKQFQVLPQNNNFYGLWRERNGFAAALRDSSDAPPEKLLQSIWQHQRLRRDQLTTLDGHRVRVLHPGFASVEGGPDFRDAVVKFGSDAPLSGDIEVDIRDSGWRAHGHDKNPAFKNVVLHVVWDSQTKKTSQTTLALKHVLDAPLAEVSLQLEHNSIRALPENLLGKCSAPLRELDAATVTTLLNQAAHVRLQNKAAHFRARAQHVGWEQSLWEGLFRALGYKHNVWPMQHLAETRALWQHGADSAFKIQSRLLGLSGLLPAELSRNKSGADDYVRRVWDGWWRECDTFAENVLPRSLWRFHGLRPANHPQRRLALAAHWASDSIFVERIEHWCQREIADKALLDSLAKILAVPRDDFWFWHWTFRSARMTKPQPLLGEQRVTDLAVNVILPWLWTRAVEGKNSKLRLEIERRYNAWPAAEDNSVLRLARQRLLGRAATGRSGLNTAAAQQGLHQIIRDFCDHSNATCDGCTFPELVKSWNRKSF
jgi:hypothetical protein